MTSCTFSWVVLHCWVVTLFLFKAHGEVSGISVNFLKAPNSTTRLNSATFLFNVLVDGHEVPVRESKPCNGSNITCKLDNGITMDCGGKEVSYTGLQDGNHRFEVCSTASPGIQCHTYNWIVDTIPPTASITSPSSVTNALNVSVNISFTEPCTGEDGKQGFTCSSVGACNLLVYGDGQVIPSSLVTLVPTRKYTLSVNLSSGVQYGKVTLEMDDNFCADNAGNRFIKSENSTFNVSFDRRNLLVNLHSEVPEKLLSLDTGNLSLLATNNLEDLKLYLNFSQPVAISATDVQNSLSTSEGTLVGIREENLGDRRFGFQVVNVPPTFAIINISFDSESISRKLGNPVSPIEPITFLYDSRRPQVELYTVSERTTQDMIPIWIQFSKTVLNFNKSSNISISGGHLVSFNDTTNSNRTLYSIKIQADEDVVSVYVPENVAEDVFGNKNQPKTLQVRHDSEPALSRVTSTFVTSTFGITCLAQGMLAVSSASLVSSGAVQGLSSSLMSDPATNLYLSLGHIQLVALTRWLPANMPNNYYDYAKALEWSIPYLKLPWEKEHGPPGNPSSKFNHLEIYQNEQAKEAHLDKAANIGHKLTGGQPSGYSSALTSEATKIGRSNYLDSQESNGWGDFWRSMFWLAVIGGSLILLHGLVILIIKIRWPHINKDYGVLTFPRFEIFCIILALPCICKASTGLVRGGEPSGVAVGTLLLGVVFLLLLSYFLFLLVGVTLGMLVLYDEDYYEQGQEQPKWRQHIRHVLGRGLRSDWSWKDRSNQVYVTILGPLFEDLRGIRKYMLRRGNPQNLDGGGDDQTQDAEASGRNAYQRGDRINPSNDEMEEVEARRVDPHKNGDGIIASYSKTEDTAGNSKRNGDDIIAPDDKTEDAGGPGEIPNKNGNYRITSDDRTEDRRGLGGNAQYGDGTIREEASLRHKLPRGPGGNAEYGDGIIREGASLRQKLLSMPRTYYTFLETVRQVILSILAAAYIDSDKSSTPGIITLSITCFLLFFVVSLRPFVSTRGLVVEIISVASEVALLALTLLLLVKEFSPGTKDKIGICMLILPFIGYVAGMLNQCYALYKQIKNLDETKPESFLRGLRKASSGFLDFVLLGKPGKGGSKETGSSANRNGSSTTTGMKQPREPTKSLPSSSKQATVAPNDPHQEY